MSIRYFYFGRPKQGTHNGVLTLAVDVAASTTPGTPPSSVNYAMSFCAPGDQFTKSKARAMAYGRVLSASCDSATRTNKKGIVVPRIGAHRRYSVTLAPGETVGDAVCRHFNTEIIRDHIPRWARDWRIDPPISTPPAPVVDESCGTQAAPGAV